MANGRSLSPPYPQSPAPHPSRILARVEASYRPFERMKRMDQGSYLDLLDHHHCIYPSYLIQLVAGIHTAS